MKKMYIYCDHCGNELDPMKDYTSINVDLNHKGTTIDLCEDCFDRLWKTIERFCGEENK